MMRARLVIGAVAIVNMIAGATVWHRLTRPSLENDEVAFYIAAAQPLYRSLPRINLESGAADPESLRTMFLEELRSAEVVGVQPSPSGAFDIQLPSSLPPSGKPSIRSISPEMHEDLLREATDLVFQRFVNRDSSQYIAYREAQGATLTMARYEKHFPGSFEAVATRLLGTDDIAEASPRSIFQASFAENIPEEIALGQGMAIAYGVDSPALSYADLSEASLGYTGWSGGLSLGFAPMTSLPYTRAELLSRFGALPCAYVGFVTYYPDRSPRPIALWFNWNPDESKWILMRVILMNFPNEEAMASMYPEF